MHKDELLYLKHHGAKIVKGGTKTGGGGVDRLSMETPWLFRILTIISNNSIKYLKYKRTVVILPNMLKCRMLIPYL